MYSTLFKQNNVLIISLKPLNVIVEFAVPSIYVVKDILEIISRDSQRPECCMWEIHLYKVHLKRIRRFLSRILDWFNSRMPFFVNKLWLWKCSDSKTVFLFWWQKCYMSPFYLPNRMNSPRLHLLFPVGVKNVQSVQWNHLGFMWL